MPMSIMKKQMNLFNAITLLASIGICFANSTLHGRSVLAQRGSYGEYSGQCEFNGKMESCFIKEWGVGLHKVTWLSDGVQAIYAETNQGSYVEQNGVRYPAEVRGGCTLPRNSCRIWFKTKNGTTVLPALHAR
jgi:hypothetical protein|tara:strand:- start:797 stop:1195 length:399 start_codon:yes stop_codon:yes gene_type:complete